MKFSSMFVPAVLALGVQACATTAPGRFDTTQVARLTQPGVDRTQVSAMLGEPAEVEALATTGGAASCVEAWHWSNSNRTSYQNLTVYFDANGAVCDHVYSGAPRARVHVPAAHSARLASRTVSNIHN